MPDRTLSPCLERAEPLTTSSDAAAWIAHTAQTLGLRYLLAHADDGVVWGRLGGSQLVTPFAHGVGAALRTTTLQEARLFDESGEVLLWRDGSGFRARLIRGCQEGESPSWAGTFEEPHLLWGDHAEPLAGGFTLLREGAEGLLHAPPVSNLTGNNVSLALLVRHYVSHAPRRDAPPGERRAQPAAGLARVATSRLVGFAPLTAAA